MLLLSIPRSFVFRDLSRLESTSLSPIFSFAISVRAPVPARLPWEPAPICFFPPFAMDFSFRDSQAHYCFCSAALERCGRCPLCPGSSCLLWSLSCLRPPRLGGLSLG